MLISTNVLINFTIAFIVETLLNVSCIYTSAYKLSRTHLFQRMLYIIICSFAWTNFILAWHIALSWLWCIRSPHWNLCQWDTRCFSIREYDFFQIQFGNRTPEASRPDTEVISNNTCPQSRSNRHCFSGCFRFVWRENNPETPGALSYRHSASLDQGFSHTESQCRQDLTQQTLNADTMLALCWASVVDAAPP